MRGARSGSVRYANGGKWYTPGSIAQGNPRTGKPHEHLRERARRLHPPGPARAAFIAAGGVAPKAKRSRKAAGDGR